MRKILLLCAIFLVTGCAEPAEQPTSLTVYTYDSLAADYGLLPKIETDFKQAHQIELNVVTFPDTGSMVNQLIAEKAEPKADVVLGIDNIDLARYEAEDLFLNPTAFDYGYVGFVYDSEAIQFDAPISLVQLANDPAYQGKIIIEQPGLSSPGTQLLVWAQTALGKDSNQAEAYAFWQALDQQVLTVAPDWNTAYYSMFMNGEAPIVLSYLTSPAYHIDQEDTERYKAIPMTDGYLKQTEYVAGVRNKEITDSQQELVSAFLEYMTSHPVQNQIATTQWMFPVIENATVPEAYDQIITPTPTETLMPANATVSANYTDWLTQWTEIFGQ